MRGFDWLFMIKCRYPECGCPISFPEGHKPSTATECVLAERAYQEAVRVLTEWKQGRYRRLSTGPQLATFIVKDGGRFTAGCDGLLEEIVNSLMEFNNG